MGARFRTLAAAGAALVAIRAAVALAPGAAAVRPLGSTRYEEPPTTDFVLAGRFDDDAVDRVVAIMRARGGQLVERRRESPRAAAGADRMRGPQAQLASNPPWTPPWSPPRASVRQPVRRTPRAHPVRPGTRLRRPADPLHIRAARSHRAR